MALWAGRFAKDTDQQVARFTASVSYDQRLYACDIEGSIAHADMLAHVGLISAQEAETLGTELAAIREEIERGEFVFREELEDVHMNIEATLIQRLGDVGAKLHTGRSRNDQVATDERLFLRAECDSLRKTLRLLQRALVGSAESAGDAICPGFTHLQHAQPVLFGHHLLAYVEMLERDRGRIADCRARMNVLPLGAGALAGSTLPLDREFVARRLGFDSICQNSMDAVSDRDYCIELLAALSLVAMHCSRLAEDIVLWSCQQFGFMELDDAFCTGSSLMPQKKNPDVAELTRGKTGRVYGSLVALLTTMKGLPMTYNRDMQEDKEGLFDALDTVEQVLGVLAALVQTARIRPQAMRRAASDPALMATDLAEWLVRQGVPFREAHRQVGQLVAHCAEQGVALDAAKLADIRTIVPAATDECLELFSPVTSVRARDIPGGTAPAQVARQVANWRKRLDSPGSRP